MLCDPCGPGAIFWRPMEAPSPTSKTAAGAARLRLNEIFHSIQGEGTRAGERCVFVRLTGCHLRCTYCDTEYAFHEGAWRELDEILADVAAYQCPFVEVTGGEPLLQPGVYGLLERLLQTHRTVALETSGAISIAGVDPGVVRIVDIKTPSSGESGRNCWENLGLLTPNDEVKFVIGTREDYEWSREVVGRHGLLQRCPVLFSPVIGPAGGRDVELQTREQNAGTRQTREQNVRTTLVQMEYELYRGQLDPQRLAEWIVADRLDVRLSLQIHKYIWSPRVRGV